MVDLFLFFGRALGHELLVDAKGFDIAARQHRDRPIAAKHAASGPEQIDGPMHQPAHAVRRPVIPIAAGRAQPGNLGKNVRVLGGCAHILAPLPRLARLERRLRQMGR